MDHRPARLPVVIIGGYLGAGKTTLINHLLHHAQGLRVAVLVNDFGSINIDAELLSSAEPGSEAGVISLAGGCLCCSFGDDLVGTLQALQQRQPAPDVVLIELSGVALPAQVARTVRLASGVDLVGSLVLVDAMQTQKLAADPYVGDTVCQQLQQADGLLLNKAGLVLQQLGETASALALSATETWLAHLAPQAPCLTLEVTDLPAAWMWDWCQAKRGPLAQRPSDGQPSPAADAQRDVAAFADRPIQHHRAHGEARFVAFSLPLPRGIDLRRLAEVLSRAELGVLRAKGMATCADGTGELLQFTPGRWQVTSMQHCGLSELVVIGLQQHLREPEIRARVQTCGHQPMPAP